MQSYNAVRGTIPTGILICGLAASLASQHKPTLAPHELGNSDAPPPIVWDAPSLPKHPLDLETAQERHVRASIVANHLEQPWSIAFLPDGSLLVTERPGRLRLIRGDRLSGPIEGVPVVQTGGARGLQGLMDVVLHPDFNRNRWLYLTYHKPPDGATTLARGTWNGDALVDVQDIFSSHAADTEASRVVFGRDGLLYLSVSAPGSPDSRRAQDPHDYAGKVVRLREDGSIPPDNPFVSERGFLPAIFTLGHRNGHGLAVNPQTGAIWQTEQGPSGGDEINVLRAAGNYGWPVVSFGRNYSGAPISEAPTQRGYVTPTIVWGFLQSGSLA